MLWTVGIRNGSVTATLLICADNVDDAMLTALAIWDTPGTVAYAATQVTS